MKTRRQLYNQYHIKPVVLSVNPFWWKEPKYEQTASNCWIYSILNNTSLNTGIDIDAKLFEERIASYWVNEKWWGNRTFAGIVACDYVKEKELSFYEIDLIKKWKRASRRNINISWLKLFGRMLKAWMVISYSRKSWLDLREDVKDNDIIDNVISDDNKWRHAVNIYFDWRTFREIGSWSKNSIYNKFSYANIYTFMKSVVAWTIKPTVWFIYDKQQRPYTEYRNKMLWWRIDYDKAYGYQCVDLFKDYMDSVLGESQGRTWNANEIRQNKYNCFWEWRKQIKWTKDIMQWDIAISLYGNYWHIGIVDTVDSEHIYLLEQNGSWSAATNWTNWDEIRVKWYKKSFFVWVWRNDKIIEDFNLEKQFIKNKINTKWPDKDTTEYIGKIRSVA